MSNLPRNRSEQFSAQMLPTETATNHDSRAAARSGAVTSSTHTTSSSSSSSSTVMKKRATSANSKQTENSVKLPRNVNKRNLFVKLGLFFNDSEDCRRVLRCLLDDHTQRQLKTVDQLVAELLEYCSQFKHLPNNNCRSFIRAVLASVTWCYDRRLENDVFAQRLDELMQHHKLAMTNLLSLICKPEFCSYSLFIDAFQDAFRAPADVSSEHAADVIAKMDIFLAACTHLQIEHKPGVKLIDMTLGFGETPLIIAARARRADTIAVLLRHGARLDVKWLSYENCLELLLFSVTLKFYDERTLGEIRRCVPLVLESMTVVGVNRLAALAHDYYPIFKQWEQVLADYSDVSTAPSLKQLCKVRVRQLLTRNWAMPRGIESLPLPRLVKQDLQISIQS